MKHKILTLLLFISFVSFSQNHKTRKKLELSEAEAVTHLDTILGQTSGDKVVKGITYLDFLAQLQASGVGAGGSGSFNPTITSPINGQTLIFDGTNWINQAPVSGVTDHLLLSNIGTNSHSQIDTHIANGGVHYLQSAISITESQISDLSYQGVFLNDSNLAISAATWADNDFGISEQTPSLFYRFNGIVNRIDGISSAQTNAISSNTAANTLNSSNIITNASNIAVNSTLISTVDSTKENNLGNPAVDDYILSSKINGIRSWVLDSGGGGGGTYTASLPLSISGGNDISLDETDFAKLSNAINLFTGKIGINTIPNANTAVSVRNSGDMWFFDSTRDVRLLFGHSEVGSNFGGLQWNRATQALNINLASTRVMTFNNNRVGIMNQTPTEALDVLGNGIFTGTVSVADGTINAHAVNIGQADDKYETKSNRIIAPSGVYTPLLIDNGKKVITTGTSIILNDDGLPIGYQQNLINASGSVLNFTLAGGSALITGQQLSALSNGANAYYEKTAENVWSLVVQQVVSENPFIDVIYFGAIPDDGNDDTVGWNAAIAQAVITGKVIKPTKGTYEIDQIQIPSNITMDLTGVVIFNPNDPSGNIQHIFHIEGVKTAISTTITATVVWTSPYDVVVADATVFAVGETIMFEQNDINSVGYTPGIDYLDFNIIESILGNTITFEKVTTSHTWDVGLEIFKLEMVENVNITGGLFIGIQDANSTLSGGGSGIHIEYARDINISNSKGTKVKIFIATAYAYDISLSNTDAYNCRNFGFFLYKAKHVKAYNLETADCGQGGYILSSLKNSVLSNLIASNNGRFDGSGDNIQMGRVDLISITGISLSQSLCYGIWIQKWSQHVTISNGNISKSTTGAINITEGSNNIIISNVDIQNQSGIAIGDGISPQCSFITVSNSLVLKEGAGNWAMVVQNSKHVNINNTSFKSENFNSVFIAADVTLLKFRGNTMYGNLVNGSTDPLNVITDNINTINW